MADKIYDNKFSTLNHSDQLQVSVLVLQPHGKIFKAFDSLMSGEHPVAGIAAAFVLWLLLIGLPLWFSQ